MANTKDAARHNATLVEQKGRQQQVIDDLSSSFKRINLEHLSRGSNYDVKGYSSYSHRHAPGSARNEYHKLSHMDRYGKNYVIRDKYTHGYGGMAPPPKFLSANIDSERLKALDFDSSSKTDSINSLCSDINTLSSQRGGIDSGIDDFTDSSEGGNTDAFDCTLSESEDGDAYVVGGYHPVKIGEVYDGRYRIEGKLGWGYFSTVWLATDMRSKPMTFVAIKFQRSAQNHTEAVRDEMSLLKKVRDQVISRSWIRTKRSYRQALGNMYNPTRGVVSFLNSFKVKGPNGTHMCVVLEPMGPNLLSLIKLYKFKGVPMHLIRKITAHVLLGLDYLHRVCGIIHTDLKPENILVTSKLMGRTPVENPDLDDPLRNPDIRPQKLDIPYVKHLIRPSCSDPSCTTSYDTPHALQEAVFRKPYDHIPFKITQPLRNSQAKAAEMAMYHPWVAEYVGYKPTVAGLRKRPVVVKTQQGPMQLKPVDVSFYDNPSAIYKICDLGNACWISHHFTNEIQTRQYRSPEAILQVGYDQSADIWSLACIVFETVTGDYLFDPHGSTSHDRDINHLQLIVELLGPIPRWMLKSSTRFRQYEREINDVKPWPLESVLMIKYKMSPLEAHELSQFLLCMLKTNPKDRLPADTLLHNRWLNGMPSRTSTARL
ncbi:protein kinase domain containing protein, putative [Babesia bigemina]|uniref:non-specific serine/threonine protein kinase n=1 Tax=Babesia bigemina TaxID=5866 RepID=A0A061D7R6_BABBI|nr:protein kinase domain containing protein, putative [Babesia bigemina]CDR96731.1 protein kinase domain containing protein, putative [Babesia bigemina]|eukprot:XP_012768917.1 protein kinase domain containing protein, putative [Babesia bigemina]